MKEHILLVYGGNSAEHTISCISAASLYRVLSGLSYMVTCVGITMHNCMYLQEPIFCYDKKTSSEFLAIIEDETKCLSLTPGKGFFCNRKNISIDVIFPIIHGDFGEDGRLQGLFDFLPIPYIGCDFFSSFLGFSKYSAKLYWERANLPVVPYLTIDVNYINNDLTGFENSKNLSNLSNSIERKLTYPIFIKPDNAGSSLGVSKIEAADEICKAIVTAAAFSKKILIEQAVSGQEIEISVIGRKNDIFISEPGEIITDQNFYTFEAKYSSKSETTKIQVPANLPQNIINKAKELAYSAFTSLFCIGLARIDMFYESKTNKLYLNEINTLPGFTENSMFIKLIENGGITWEELMEKLIRFSKEEFKERQN